jgi:hypothetical protein
MPIEVAICDDSPDVVGNSIGDVQNLLPDLLPSIEDTSFQCLRFVDRYGITVFNELQIPTVLEELDRLRQGANRAGRELLDRIEDLARQSGPNELLTFLGD